MLFLLDPDPLFEMRWEPDQIQISRNGHIRFPKLGRIRIRTEHQGLKSMSNGTFLAVYIDQSYNTISKYR